MWSVIFFWSINTKHKGTFNCTSLSTCTLSLICSPIIKQFIQKAFKQCLVATALSLRHFKELKYTLGMCFYPLVAFGLVTKTKQLFLKIKKHSPPPPKIIFVPFNCSPGIKWLTQYFSQDNLILGKEAPPNIYIRVSAKCIKAYSLSNFSLLNYFSIISNVTPLWNLS